MKVIITAPSTNVKHNVSGISAHTRLLIQANSLVDYRHFIVGKRDHQIRDARLFFHQFFFIFSFFNFLILNRDCKIVHINIPLERFSLIKNFILTLVAKGFLKRVIIHLRGGVYSNSAKIPFFLLIILRLTSKLADHIITLGNNEKVMLIKQINTTSKKVTSLPNMTFFPLNLPEKSDKEFNIIFLGRIDKDKGLDVLFNTLLLLKSEIDFKFFVAGTGPDADDFLSKCKNDLLYNFEYLGVLDNEAKSQILAKCHLFILPSLYEGLPNALLESMAFGLVPLVTAVGSIPELIQNDINGIFIDGKSPIEISKIIMKLKYNKRIFERISLNARNTIFENYNIDNYILKINQIYKFV
jgi:glycosyltransferase involved in cell wall biosynthesis